MRTLRQVTRWTEIVRASRTRLFWLALAFAAAHSVGVWHPYSHAIAESVDPTAGKLHTGAACAQCIAVAGTGGAPGAEPGLHLHRLVQDAPHFMPLATLQQSSPRQAYAIRAPPLLAS